MGRGHSLGLGRVRRALLLVRRCVYVGGLHAAWPACVLESRKHDRVRRVYAQEANRERVDVILLGAPSGVWSGVRRSGEYAPILGERFLAGSALEEVIKFT